VTAALSIPPVRRRLHQRAQAAWRAEGQLTFVCLGNICRSPFAAALMPAGEASRRAVASAGTHPRSGRQSPEAAVRAARDWSVDLGPHRSRHLDAALVRDSAALFVFDVDNLLRIRREFPESRGRLHLLGALSPDGPVVIADPYGKPDAEFQRVYRQIAGIIERASEAAGAPAR
jgi:protein-tyrosine phosphatase